MSILLDDSMTLPFIDPIILDTHERKIFSIHQQIHSKTGPGYEYLGWVDQPGRISSEQIREIEQIAQDFRSRSNCFVLVGIGGSYAGAKSTIAFYQSFQESIPRDIPSIHYAGINLSPVSTHRLLESLEGKDITINVVSKSGGTFETSSTFQLLLEYMKKRYSPEELQHRILITTDPVKGSLREFASQNHFPTLPVDSDIGGRYSLLTSVGLFPMAMMGVPIQDLLRGAVQAMNELNTPDNLAYRYALLRYTLSLKTIHVEALSTFEPAFETFTEWWKQLFGESEGKNHKGLFPVGLKYSTDLHSLGQYMQDGKRILLETFLTIANLPDYLKRYQNPLTQTSYEQVNQKAKESTMKAHFDGGIPCLSLQIPDTTMASLGYLYYFMMKACAMSSYLQEVNPFDQPGVEKYKSYMQQ